MQYLINAHFRVELNVSKDQPLPQINEFLSLEEISESQNLLRIDLDIADQLVRDDVGLSGKRRDSY